MQNTFYGNTSINLGILAQSTLADIRNNLFSSGSSITHVYSQGLLTGAVVDHNCYTSFANEFGFNGSAYSSVSTFHSATAFETHGLDATVGLTNPGSHNFQLLGSSQCIGLGTSTAGVAVDYGDNAYANPPAAGAYQ